MKRFEQQEREKDENGRICGSSEGYIQFTMQSEELELVKCCAMMLPLTGVTAAGTRDGTTHHMDDLAVPPCQLTRSFPAGCKQLAGAHCASSSAGKTT